MARSRALRLCLPLAALLLGACSSSPARKAPIPDLLNHAPWPIPETHLLEVSPAMSSFVDRHTGQIASRNERAWALTYATLDPYLLDFEYDPMMTLTSAEAFKNRKGNCLTFSSLFIAMAREAGLEAWYQQVEVLPEWNSINETLLVTLHVNAAVRHGGSEFTIDISRAKRMPNAAVRRLSDREAQAQYFNNLGADALVDAHLPRAYAYFREALRTDSTLAYVWSNLGVVLKRNGQVEDARSAYLTALQLDSGQSVALNNLYIIHSEQGDLEAAEAIRARVEKNRLNNPYYLFHLGAVAARQQRHAEAIDLLEQALRLEDSDYRLHLALAESLHHAGRGDAAASSLERARELLPPGSPKTEFRLPDGAVATDSP